MSDPTVQPKEGSALYGLAPSLPAEWVPPLERALSRLPLLADLTHADVSLICPYQDAALAVGHASPSLGPELHVRPIVGQRISLASDAAIRQAFRMGTPITRTAGLTLRGVPVRQRAVPIRLGGIVAGVLNFEKSLLLHHASSYPDAALERPVQLLTQAFFGSVVEPTALLTLLHAGDPIVVIGEVGEITYLNQPATHLYHSLGFADPLVGRTLDERTLPAVVVLSTAQDELHQQCEMQIGDLVLLKRVFPLEEDQAQGALWILTDVTELRRREGALLARAAVMQELHHQVKNSLQMIASLLRMELRRADSPGARAALEESIARVISIAAVHDSLSREGTEMVDLRDLVGHLLSVVASGAAPAALEAEVFGPALLLPAPQAVPVALLINELVTNAVKHAFPEQSQGRIEVVLSQEAEAFVIEVRDDGAGLPAGFSLTESANLGLQIAQNLVRRDLGGSLEFVSDATSRGSHSLGSTSGGTRAIVRFPRAALEDPHG